VVISDAKLITDQDASGTVSPSDLFTPEVMNYSDPYPFGFDMPGRQYSSGTKFRYSYNGKEKDQESGLQDYGFRIYDGRISKFLSIDPLTKNYPELTPYQFASNTPIQAMDLDGLEAFFVHGTESSPHRWLECISSIKVLAGLTNNTTINMSFSWKKLSSIVNDKINRAYAANDLVNHILKNRKEGEEITLIGHSHGGNVAIQAAKLLNEVTGEKVNIITISTPAYNGENDPENPNNTEGQKSINDMVNLRSENDPVQGGLAGEDTYNKSSNNRKQYIVPTRLKGIDAHSFDIKDPNALEKRIKGNLGNGVYDPIKKLKPIEKSEDK
jgi:RHS repeat-associated protein